MPTTMTVVRPSRPTAELGLKWTLIACQPLDVLTTAIVILALGGMEANPVAREILAHPAGYFALLFLKLAVALRLLKMKIERPLDMGILALAAFLYTGVVAWNTSLIVRVLIA